LRRYYRDLLAPRRGAFYRRVTEPPNIDRRMERKPPIINDPIQRAINPRGRINI
jgi:hypothetical protein